MIYFDNAATSLTKKELFNAFLEYEYDAFANSTSIHRLGQKANNNLAKAKLQILSLLGLNDGDFEVIITSGATEANNLALKGTAFAYQNRGKHLICSAIEHPSVLETMKSLSKMFGFTITILPVDEFGLVDSKELLNAINDQTILVSIMVVNNEIGSVNNVKEISQIVKRFPKCFLHMDTTQSLGKTKVDYSLIDMFPLSLHKLGGPKGIGALIKRKSIKLIPLLDGGGQENGFRSGTVNVSGACTLAKAIRLSLDDFESKYTQANKLNQHLRELLEKNDEFVFNSSEQSTPFIFNFSLKSKKASVVVEALSNKEIYVSSLSACHSKSEKGSYVVKSISKSETLSHNTIRVSFSSENTLQEVDIFVAEINEIVKRVK